MTMRRYAIRDEDGTVIAAGCGTQPPTEGDIAVVRAFAEWLRTQPDDPEAQARYEESRRRIHERLRRMRMLRCQVCGAPSFEFDECRRCDTAADDAARRRADL